MNKLPYLLRFSYYCAVINQLLYNYIQFIADVLKAFLKRNEPLSSAFPVTFANYPEQLFKRNSGDSYFSIVSFINFV